ncbi:MULTISPECIES: hypothetical protein [unclassified Mesorhizobium]|nr:MULTISPECIES: hypothetical protein [unclassified Mesorhizobium]WJI50292.1 hypothetical protein NLY44_27550 [Mesorhizobium sp. C089B]
MAGTTDVPVLKNKTRSKPISGPPFAPSRIQRTSPPEAARFLVAPELLADKSRRCAKFGSSVALSRSGVLTCGLTYGHCEHVHIDGDPVYVKHSGRLRALPVQMIINGMRQRLNESV